MKYETIHHICDWVKEHLINTIEDYNNLNDDTFFTMGHSIYSTTTANGVVEQNIAFAYTTKGLLRNAKLQRIGANANGKCGGNADATFNLIPKGWAMLSFGCRGLRCVRAGGTEFDSKLSQQYRPYAFAVARTERGEGYQLLFESTR
mmetsp:Transcript_21594/g.30948  ORF Transcript_21594/g.30948 Transcript_21594/m.30948 type:complete len:147 (-) Transcript_21594:403-843(-)